MKTVIKKLFLSLMLIILFGTSLYAQNSALQDSVQLNKYDFSQFASETWGFIKQPTKWDGSDWLRIGALGAVTFLIMQIDEPVRRLVNGNTKYAKSFPIEFSNMWGEIYFTEALFGGFSLYALYNGDKTAHKIAFEIAQATFYTFYVNSALKFVIGRARPFLNQGSQVYVPFSKYSNIDHQSLPSGHTAIVMALTTILSRNAKPTWLKILAYVPAAMSMVGRVYLDKHWTSDVLLGGAIGYFTATWVVDQHEKIGSDNRKEEKPGTGSLNVQPYLFEDTYGLAFTFHL
jgi:membrane-associated phospholipid phosphatase